MKMKKRLSLLTAAALAASAFAGLAFAATEDDLATISSNATFIAQNETTESFLKDSIHWNNQLLTLNGDNTYNTKKGNSLFNDTEVPNLLQVKQGRNMVLSVGGACTIDVYHDDNSGRIIQAGSTNRGTDYTVVQNVLANGTKNYDVDTITVPTAGLVYIGASGDVYVSVIDVKFGGGAPNPTATPEATETPAEPTAAPAELKAVEDTTTWTHADFEIGAYTAAQLSKNADLQINGAEGKAINVDEKAIKLGGTGSAESRNVKFIPAADGTVKVTAVNGKVSETDRFFVIENAGTVTESEVIDTTNSVELTVNVKANEPVFIYSGKSGVNLTEIVYTKGAAVVEPTKYTITLVDGDTTRANVVEENGTFEFPTPNEPVGVEFAGWMNSADTTDIKMGGDTLTVTGDATYTAVWNEVVAPIVDTGYASWYYTEPGSPFAKTFVAEVTSGTHSISALKWIANNNVGEGMKVESDPIEVNIAPNTTVRVGLIVETSEELGIGYLEGITADIEIADDGAISIR